MSLHDEEERDASSTDVGDVAAEVVRLDGLLTTLRSECSWDRAQDHDSLCRHLLEETHEVLEALDDLHASQHGDGATRSGAYAHLKEELGDLLFQVMFHALLAQEAEQFDLAQVACGVHDKLVARHPHLFAGAEVPDGDLALAWERTKLAEKQRASVMDGIPSTLGALATASKVVSKAQAVAPDTVEQSLHPDDGRGVDDEEAIGRELLEIVVRARALGIDAESALRRKSANLAHRVREREA